MTLQVYPQQEVNQLEDTQEVSSTIEKKKEPIIKFSGNPLSDKGDRILQVKAKYTIESEYTLSCEKETTDECYRRRTDCVKCIAIMAQDEIPDYTITSAHVEVTRIK